VEDNECAGWTTSCQWTGLSGDAIHRERQKVLDVTDSSMQPTVAKRRQRDDMYNMT